MVYKLISLNGLLLSNYCMIILYLILILIFCIICGDIIYYIFQNEYFLSRQTTNILYLLQILLIIIYELSVSIKCKIFIKQKAEETPILSNTYVHYGSEELDNDSMENDSQDSSYFLPESHRLKLQENPKDKRNSVSSPRFLKHKNLEDSF